MSFLDPLAPYLLYIKLGAGAVLLSFVFVGGCKHGEANSAVAITALNKTIGAQTVAIQSRDLALKLIDDEAARLQKEEKAARGRESDAGKVAQAHEKALKQDLARLKSALDAARARSPECDALLSTSVKKVCHL